MKAREHIAEAMRRIELACSLRAGDDRMPGKVEQYGPLRPTFRPLGPWLEEHDLSWSDVVGHEGEGQRDRRPGEDDGAGIPAGLPGRGAEDQVDGRFPESIWEEK